MARQTFANSCLVSLAVPPPEVTLSTRLIMFVQSTPSLFLFFITSGRLPFSQWSGQHFGSASGSISVFFHFFFQERVLSFLIVVATGRAGILVFSLGAVPLSTTPWTTQTVKNAFFPSLSDPPSPLLFTRFGSVFGNVHAPIT